MKRCRPAVRGWSSTAILLLLLLPLLPLWSGPGNLPVLASGAGTAPAGIAGPSAGTGGVPGPGGETSRSGPAVSTTPATFDLYCPFPTQPVAPSAGLTRATLYIDVRAISAADPEVFLTAFPETPGLTCVIDPLMVRLDGPGAVKTCRVSVTAATSMPDDSEGWIRIVGRRGEEYRDFYLEIIACKSKPELSLGKVAGAQEQDLKLAVRGPVTFELLAANAGAVTDTFPLSAEAPAGWSVRFEDSRGRPLEAVTVRGVTVNQMALRPVAVRAVVTPPVGFAAKDPVAVTLKLGATAYLKVRVLCPGLLFSVNDLGGFMPHVHQVLSGAVTTYNVIVSNPTSAPIDVHLSAAAANGAAAGWRISLESDRIAGLGPGKQAQAQLTVVAPVGPATGTARFRVAAEATDGTAPSVTLGAAVTQTPKIYIYAIDSMSYDYLTFNRTGDGPGRDGDWLMPHMHEFMADAVSFTNARALMPSLTDMNHTSILTGSAPGTEGIYAVTAGYAGTDVHGREVLWVNSVENLRYGPDGQRIKRIFDLAEEHNPEALCAFACSKSWLADLHASDPSIVERKITSSSYPIYVNNPSIFVLGDPPTDTAKGDPLQVSGVRLANPRPTPVSRAIADFMPEPLRSAGIGLLESTTWHFMLPWLFGQKDLLLGLGLGILPINVAAGEQPGGHADDSFLGGAVRRMIVEEDPDVLYINMADLDHAGHLLGASSALTEWRTQPGPSTWYDRSKYNWFAKRKDALDICRQADDDFGRFVNLLKTRGTYDSSIIVLVADHTMVNVKRPENGYSIIDTRGILREHGLLMGDHYLAQLGGISVDYFYCRDAATTARIENILEDYTVQDPELGEIHPLVVFDREEQRTGVDTRTSLRVSPHELYSAYWVGRDYTGPDQMKWPDLFVFYLDNYGGIAWGDQLSQKANPIGMDIGMVPVGMGLTYCASHGSFGTTHIPLVFKAPGVKAGAVVEDPVNTSDIAPTIYQLLGWTAGPWVDGRPLPLPSSKH